MAAKDGRSKVRCGSQLLRPMGESIWPLVQNERPRAAYLARNVRERGFLVDHLMDLIQRSVVERC